MRAEKNLLKFACLVLIFTSIILAGCATRSDTTKAGAVAASNTNLASANSHNPEPVNCGEIISNTTNMALCCFDNPPPSQGYSPTYLTGGCGYGACRSNAAQVSPGLTEGWKNNINYYDTTAMVSAADWPGSEPGCHRGKAIGENVNNIYCNGVLLGMKRVKNVSQSGVIIDQHIEMAKFDFEGSIVSETPMTAIGRDVQVKIINISCVKKILPYWES